MKEGVKLLTIEPSANYIDFITPLNDTGTNADDSNQTLKGNLRLVTTKTIKMKSVTVKFVGESTVFQTADQQAITTPILPRLKAKVQSKSMVLSAGEHCLPWVIDIPNIYPMSFSNKRAAVRYTICIKLSLGINKSITADRTITVKRHRLPSQALAALVSTSTFEKTLAHGFHYRIEIPKVICIEQGYLPISLKYEYLDRSKKQLVKYISTHMTQIEVYRTRSISKIEADMANMASNKKHNAVLSQSLYELYKMGDPGLIRLVKPNKLVTTNEIDKTNEDYSSVPLLLTHHLDAELSHAIESPLVAISHQLELVFHFGKHAEDIRVKVPVVVSSVPDSRLGAMQPARSVQKYTLETVLHKLPSAVNAPATQQSHRSTMDKDSTVNLNTQSEGSRKSLRKSISDLELRRTMDEKHQSIASSNYYRRSQYTTTTSDYYTTDATSVDSVYSPISPTFSSSDSVPSSPRQESPFATFTGLHPPPRRKKTPVSPNMKPLPSPFLPLPPVPSEQPIMNHAPASSSTRNKRANSVDYIAKQLIPKQIDKEKMLDISTYSSSITNKYVSATLPPIPSRHKIPSAPKDYRMTKMYYDEEDSDEEE